MVTAIDGGECNAYSEEHEQQTQAWGVFADGQGYGGYGGASSAAAGGVTYGSAQQPVDYGSGGGRGWQGTTVGGEGGGVIRFTVGGALTLNGRSRYGSFFTLLMKEGTFTADNAAAHIVAACRASESSERLMPPRSRAAP